MKKLLSLTLMAAGLLLATSHRAEAVWYRGTPKEVYVSSQTSTAVLVTPAVSTNTPSTAQYMPGAVYQVILGTGAASEYIQMVDTNTCTGVTAIMAVGNVPAQAYQFLGPRLLYSSTTLNTTFTFDPPIRFDQGLCIIDSAATGGASITYELGRGISGQ